MQQPHFFDDDDTLPIQPVRDEPRAIVYVYETIVSDIEGGILADVSGVSEAERGPLLNDFVVELQASGFTVVDRRPREVL